jgi:hypothetical protein
MVHLRVVGVNSPLIAILSDKGFFRFAEDMTLPERTATNALEDPFAGSGDAPASGLIHLDDSQSSEAVQALGMRAGIVIDVTRSDRRRLEAIVADRSAPQKHAWRASIILATAEGCGTLEIMRRSGKSKPAVWRWQARFMAEGVGGLTRDKTRRQRGKQALESATRRRRAPYYEHVMSCSTLRRRRRRSELAVISTIV